MDTPLDIGKNKGSTFKSPPRGTGLDTSKVEPDFTTLTHCGLVPRGVLRHYILPSRIRIRICVYLIVTIHNT